MNKFEQVGHAALCVGNKCLDNGDLTNHVFDKSEISYHGEIMESFRGKSLAGS
jgi:ribosomal protein L18